MLSALKSIDTRANLYKTLRAFFSERNITEVDVPIIGASTVSDPHISSFSTEFETQPFYLQTSPEYFLKRLLAWYSEPIYSLGKVFRIDPLTKRHNPEFTMLEWYRPGFDDHQLIQEVIDLILELDYSSAINKVSYQSLFEQYLGLDPHRASASELADLARLKLDVQWQDDNKSTWLDLLFSHCIEPKLDSGITIVYDYPICQCALARVESDDTGLLVARRFEVFWQGIELANGYWELVDCDVQRGRFELDNIQRQSAGLPAIQSDEKLLSALKQGIPECAGVALGVDRLLMCLTGARDISDVLIFPFGEL